MCKVNILSRFYRAYHPREMLVRHISSSLRDAIAVQLDELKANTGLSEYEILNQAVSFAYANNAFFRAFVGIDSIVIARMDADQKHAQVGIPEKLLMTSVGRGTPNQQIRMDTGEGGKVVATVGPDGKLVGADGKPLQAQAKQKDQTQLRA